MSRFVLAAVIAIALVAAATASTGAVGATSADAQLNATYKRLLALLGDADAQRLREAQRAWIGFRDKECDFRAQGRDGGSIAAGTRAQCIDELGRQRSADLQARIDCPQGDVACLPRHAAPPAAAVDAGDGGGGASCNQSAGRQQAALYADQCMQVSPATHPPCNGDNACDLIIDEIRRGCAMIDSGAPAFCAQYRLH